MVKVYCKTCKRLVFEDKKVKSVFGNFICVSCDKKDRAQRKLKVKEKK